MGKGGTSQTTTVDPVYNAGLLEISKQQQGWAGQMFNMFKYGTTYDPTEKVTGYYDQSGKFVEGKPEEVKVEKATARNIDKTNAPSKWTGEGEWKTINPEYADWEKEQLSAVDKKSADMAAQSDKKYTTITRGELNNYNPNGQTSEMQYLQNLVNSNQSLLGLQTNLSKGQLESQTRLLPQQEKLTEAQIQEAMAQTGLSRAQIDAQMKLLPQQTGLSLEQIASQRKLLPQQTAAQESRLGLYQTTMKDINKGINVGQRMDQAQAAVQHAFKNTNESNRRDIASYGLDPSSGRYASQNRAASLAQGAGIAGARTGAKNYAEAEDFERKKAGLNFQI